MINIKIEAIYAYYFTSILYNMEANTYNVKIAVICADNIVHWSDDDVREFIDKEFNSEDDIYKISIDDDDVECNEDINAQHADIDSFVFYDCEEETYNGKRFYWSDRFGCYKTKSYSSLRTGSVKWYDILLIT